MNKLMLFIGRGTYINKNHIIQSIRYPKTDLNSARYEITVAVPKGQESVHRIYETDAAYDHISNFLKEETMPVTNHREFAEYGRSW